MFVATTPIGRICPDSRSVRSPQPDPTNKLRQSRIPPSASDLDRIQMGRGWCRAGHCLFGSGESKGRYLKPFWKRPMASVRSFIFLRSTLQSIVSVVQHTHRGQPKGRGRERSSTRRQSRGCLTSGRPRKVCTRSGYAARGQLLTLPGYRARTGKVVCARARNGATGFALDVRIRAPTDRPPETCICIVHPSPAKFRLYQPRGRNSGRPKDRSQDRS